jgi:hypothetical protein
VHFRIVVRANAKRRIINDFSANVKPKSLDFEEDHCSSRWAVVHISSYNDGYEQMLF